MSLGVAHLILTLLTRRLHPRDSALQSMMARDSPRLTSETSMWKAWMGFNVSHSLGAILFGCVYGYLSMDHPLFLFDSPFLLMLGFAVLLVYFWLGRVYWFSRPFFGILVATALYLTGLVTGVLR